MLAKYPTKKGKKGNRRLTANVFGNSLIQGAAPIYLDACVCFKVVFRLIRTHAFVFVCFFLVYLARCACLGRVRDNKGKVECQGDKYG